MTETIRQLDNDIRIVGRQALQSCLHPEDYMKYPTAETPEVITGLRSCFNHVNLEFEDSGALRKDTVIKAILNSGANVRLSCPSTDAGIFCLEAQVI